jgi:hypothetical protein
MKRGNSKRGGVREDGVREGGVRKGRVRKPKHNDKLLTKKKGEERFDKLNLNLDDGSILKGMLVHLIQHKMCECTLCKHVCRDILDGMFMQSFIQRFVNALNILKSVVGTEEEQEHVEVLINLLKMVEYPLRFDHTEKSVIADVILNEQ